ncbi:Uncharacterised protein [Pragia fontium]|uniref:hypothetical protein n=1 Tax=Pragia fontium TaxID=82985 RepID=UPI000E06AC9F|nr:hypothetical protein [Pragia fontium]SUB83782.1 Uncharacterised protein [Pragia fontium]
MLLLSVYSKFKNINPLLAIVPPLFLLFLLPFLHVSSSVTVIIALLLLAAMISLFRQRERALAVLIFIGLSVIWIWHAYFTWQGYYWVNARELESLAHQITTYGKIQSLDMGIDDSYQDGDRTVRYDAYRFLNGTRITLYQDGHDPSPDSGKPIWFIDSYCQQHEISLKAYYQMRDELERLKINGFSLMDNGDISFNLWRKGGVPWTINLVRIADGTHPLDGDTLEKLNAHWYIATYS